MKNNFHPIIFNFGRIKIFFQGMKKSVYKTIHILYKKAAGAVPTAFLYVMNKGVYNPNSSDIFNIRLIGLTASRATSGSTLISGIS